MKCSYPICEYRLNGTSLQVKWSGVRTQYSTTPFVDEMYDRLQEILNDYGVIISRWPEYTFALENVSQYASLTKCLIFMVCCLM